MARQLAAADAAVDVRMEMGWERDDQEVPLLAVDSQHAAPP